MPFHISYAGVVPDTDLRPLRRDAERNRRRILEAAAEVFATRGFSASFEEIAGRADVAVGTVYRRFPCRQGLIDALFEDRMSEVVAIFRRAEHEPDAWVALVSVLEQLLEHLADDRGTWELMMCNSRGGRHIGEARSQVATLSGQLLRRAQQQGAVRADLESSDLPLVKLMLGSLVDATRELDRDVWRRYLTIVLDGMRARPDTPTPFTAAALSDDLVPCAMSAAVRSRA